MSNPDRPTLNCWVNAASTPRSASRVADGTSSAIVARNSKLACRRALTRLYSCVWCFRPPRRNDAPSRKSVLVTTAPAIDALTSVNCPERNAVSAMINSVRLPSVALSSPPTQSPVLTATDSVASLSNAASGTIARTDSTNSSVCASASESLAGEHGGHEDEQPQERIATNFLQQRAHVGSLRPIQRELW